MYLRFKLHSSFCSSIMAPTSLTMAASLPPEVAAERWGVPMAYFSLGSNSRVRSVRARRELGWVPRHGSVIEWIQDEMPNDELPSAPS